MMPKARIVKAVEGWEMQVYDQGNSSITYRVTNLATFDHALSLAHLYRTSFLTALADKYMPFAEKLQVN